MRYKAVHVVHMLMSICDRLDRRTGLVRHRSPELFDLELGRIAAHMLYLTSESQRDAWLTSDFMHRYCSHTAHRSFTEEIASLGAEPLFQFRDGRAVRAVGHPGFGVSARLNVGEAVKYGALLGWQSHWCPFVGRAAAAWFDVFSAHPRHETWDAWADELLTPDLEALTH